VFEHYRKASGEEKWIFLMIEAGHVLWDHNKDPDVFIGLR